MTMKSSPFPESLKSQLPDKIFRDEVMKWAKRIGVEPKEIRLRLMKNKWASCSSNGRLTFNTEILWQPASFRREAIVHELLHLKLPNHGKLFKNLMRAFLSQNSSAPQLPDS